MPRVAAERAAQEGQWLVLRHATAGLVGERDHAIDIGEIGQWVVVRERILLEDIGDHAADMAAPIHRGEDADIVSAPDPPSPPPGPPQTPPQGPTPSPPTPTPHPP